MSQLENKVTGGCLCGAIRYESDKPPYLAGYCHCKTCQKSLGNAFATAAFFNHDSFRYVIGQPKWYQSYGAKRGFCEDCGSPIVFQRNGFEGEYCAIWVGTLDQPELIEPQAHWHSENKLSWVDISADLHDYTPDDHSQRYDSINNNL